MNSYMDAVVCLLAVTLVLVVVVSWWPTRRPQLVQACVRQGHGPSHSIDTRPWWAPWRTVSTVVCWVCRTPLDPTEAREADERWPALIPLTHASWSPAKPGDTPGQLAPGEADPPPPIVVSQ